MIKKMKNSTTNTSTKSESSLKISQSKDTVDIIIYTEEKVYRKRYITVDIHNKNCIDNAYNLTNYCLKNYLINENEEVIDYEIEQA